MPSLCPLTTEHLQWTERFNAWLLPAWPQTRGRSLTWERAGNAGRPHPRAAGSEAAFKPLQWSGPGLTLEKGSLQASSHPRPHTRQGGGTFVIWTEEDLRLSELSN